MNKILKNILIAIASILAVILIGGWIVLANAGSICGWVIKAQTGFNLSYQKFSINPFLGRVDISNLQLTNPQDFNQKDFIDLKTAIIDLDLSHSNLQKLHFSDIVIDLGPITLVKNSEGTGNLQAIKQAFATTSQPQTKPNSPPSASKSKIDLAVDHIYIKTTSIVTVDETSSPAQTQTTKLALSYERTNIDSLNQLSKSLAGAVLPTLLRSSGGQVGQMAGSVLDIGSSTLGQSVDASLSVSSDAVNATTQGLNKGVKKTSSAIKGLFKSLK